MCQFGCIYEDREGECTARSIDGFRPCDGGYLEAQEADDYERDRADEFRAEMRREE